MGVRDGRWDRTSRLSATEPKKKRKLLLRTALGRGVRVCAGSPMLHSAIARAEERDRDPMRFIVQLTIKEQTKETKSKEE